MRIKVLLIEDEEGYKKSFREIIECVDEVVVTGQMLETISFFKHYRELGNLICHKDMKKLIRLLDMNKVLISC